MLTQNLLLGLVCLASLVGLALHNERQGELLLRRVPTEGLRRWGCIAGWALIAAALAWGLFRWGPSIGGVAAMGWFSVIAAALVFNLHKWPEEGGRKGATRIVTPDPGVVVKAMPLRRLILAALIVLPLGFVVLVQSVAVKPVMREDAVQGKVGPWTFRLAEVDQAPPKLMAMGIPMKAYQLRFCQSCDADIRSAYLKVHKPRSLRGAGLVFNGNRHDRSVEIQLPSNMRDDAELWLTVEGKDGQVHYASWPVSQLSPSTAKWFASR